MALPTTSSIHPFKLSIAESTLDDLQMRLRLSRWPDKETVTDWSQGVPLASIQELCLYWQTKYDWRQCEALLNSYPQFTTIIDGVNFYFLHIRSKHENALPLLLTHGWPGSVLEFRHVIDELVEPQSHGGCVEDAFHLIIPALPGYAFSGKPTEKGWDYHRTARAWAELMHRLGYVDRGWVAQGGDWGAHVAASLGHQAPRGLKSVHLNSIYFEAKASSSRPSPRNMPNNSCRRRRVKSRFTIRRARREPCILTVFGMLDTADTPCSNQRDHKQSATGSQIRRLHRLLGFLRNTGIGPITTATWRQYLERTRCST